MKRSFKKYISTTKLPVIKMSIYGKSYYFLIDTGANINYITYDAYADFEDKALLVGGRRIIGIGGKNILMKVIDVEYFIDHHKINDQFCVIDNVKCFDLMEEETHCRVLGMLGTSFLSAGKFTIDYNSLCITSHLPKKSKQ